MREDEKHLHTEQKKKGACHVWDDLYQLSYLREKEERDLAADARASLLNKKHISLTTLPTITQGMYVTRSALFLVQ